MFVLLIDKAQRRKDDLLDIMSELDMLRKLGEGLKTVLTKPEWNRFEEWRSGNVCESLVDVAGLGQVFPVKLVNDKFDNLMGKAYR